MISLEWEEARTVWPQYMTERAMVADGIEVDDYHGDTAWLVFAGGSGGGYALGGTPDEIARCLRRALAALDKGPEDADEEDDGEGE